MNIDKFVKFDKYIVIELDGDVEYLLDDNAVKEIKENKQKIDLVRLIDRKSFLVDRKKIEESLTGKGVIDYLDKGIK